MCGVVGIIGRSRIDHGPDVLRIMRDAMTHRGPDDAGEWWSKCGLIGLAHRRLSILDLSPAGHQPMQSKDSNLIIVFNGEIYNHESLRIELMALGETFQSSSDTEVILSAWSIWGQECVRRLVGMFVFAIYDIRTHCISLVRDRSGEKPLFYRLNHDQLVFASELKALLADSNAPRKIDPVALDLYLCHGYIPGTQCILAGYAKLPAGHILTINTLNWESNVHQYWNLPAANINEDMNELNLVNELELILRNSVRDQLVADVPVGVLLSGGIDSSLITALATQTSSRPIKTFTITFPGHNGIDESVHARLIADHFSTDHTELEAQPASADLLPELARQFDEPMCDSSMIPTYLVSRLIRKHCKVALGGDGGDELFGGYTVYQWVLRQHQARQWLPRYLRESIGWAAEQFVPVGVRGRNYLVGLRGDTSTSIAGNTMFFSRNERVKMCPILQSTEKGNAELAKSKLIDVSRGLPGMVMAMDFQTYLREDILVKVDRASMLASLEVRSPFLDHRLIEFAFSKVPNRLRANANIRKILLRRLAEKCLPKEFDLDRKQGFSIPLREWLNGPWANYISDILGNIPHDWFRQSSVQALLDGQRRGRSNMERIFSLVILELWRKIYRITL